MALFMIERNFAEKLEIDDEGVKSLIEINDGCGVKWLSSFLSADQRKTYCLYEALNADAIREAALKANLPADSIVELTGELSPEALLGQ